MGPGCVAGTCGWTAAGEAWAQYGDHVPPHLAQVGDRHEQDRGVQADQCLTFWLPSQAGTWKGSGQWPRKPARGSMWLLSTMSAAVGHDCPQIVTGLGSRSQSHSYHRSAGGRKEKETTHSRHILCAASLVTFISYHVSQRYKSLSPS